MVPEKIRKARGSSIKVWPIAASNPALVPYFVDDRIKPKVRGPGDRAPETVIRETVIKKVRRSKLSFYL